jgi:hypothetical protein
VHGVFERLMQAMIAEAAARRQADLDLVSVDSTTARAHHHADGMALDGELAAALAEAAEQDKGLHQRGQTPATVSSEDLNSVQALGVDSRDSHPRQSLPHSRRPLDAGAGTSADVGTRS